MNQTVLENRADKYFFVFHGTAPAILMARVAYRRAGLEQRVLHMRKIIKCPYCKEPLTDVDRNTKVELYRYPARNQVRCQSYPVCPNCGNEVGMILA